MFKFIEEFYYGNIDPQARSTKQNKAVQKQMEVLMLNLRSSSIFQCASLAAGPKVQALKDRPCRAAVRPF